MPVQVASPQKIAAMHEGQALGLYAQRIARALDIQLPDKASVRMLCEWIRMVFQIERMFRELCVFTLEKITTCYSEEEAERWAQLFSDVYIVEVSNAASTVRRKALAIL